MFRHSAASGRVPRVSVVRYGVIPSPAQYVRVRVPVLFALAQEERKHAQVYGFSKVNAGARGNTRDLRVLWALEEMQLPFELAGMDHPAHDLNAEGYRRLSPFEQIPSIDDDGVLLSERVRSWSTSRGNPVG